MDELVSTDWLAANLDEPDLALVDCSYFMPAMGRDARAEFEAGHIPGARFLDIDEVADHDHPAPHMLPSAEEFGRAMEDLGVGRGDRIVVYDNSPLRTAARGWFMLRHFGAERVAVLDGGLGKWIAEGRAVEGGDAKPRQARFEPSERVGEVVSKQQLINGTGLPVADARPRARFEGREPDPRPGVASGHIPGARNLPMTELYREDGTLRPAEELTRAFAAAGIDPAAPFIASCGSGVTANSIILASRRLGGRDARLYDGSWSEWGADPATPKESGPT
jgi:thiosulfate/3-mercaptopyruvate sulfurtransferase